VARITSPETSLSGLVGLIDQARTSLDIQQMTFDSAWSGGTNPLIAALERASQRGVRIRVLLNDESVFNHGHPSRPKNQPTVDHLNTLANTQARIANLAAMGVDYIHNKGVLVDGQITLISSINWDENSIQRNREAAVAITGAEVNAHYEALFERDWQVSGGSAALRETRLPIFLTPPTTESVKDCPASLRVTARIGKLRLDRDDDSFASIDGATVSHTFVRERGAEDCVLTSEDGIGSLSRRSFVEIRSTRDGYSVALEGYTPQGGKLYSVRAKIAKDSGLSGSFDANVFNGSAAHEFLGKATLDLETAN
jgi:PLD-like domain